MIRNPKIWRQRAGLTLAEVAARVAIGGRNPARTYQRYENGECACPLSVIVAIERLSGAQIGAKSWQRARQRFLTSQRSSAPSAREEA